MKVCLVIFLCYTIASNAQTRFEKTIDGTSIKEIYIVLQTAANINIATSQSDQIQITATSDGEYHDQMILSAIESNPETLKIQDIIQPLFDDPNDKLSAHKTFALEVNINLPEALRVMVMALSASLYAQGNYQNLSASLQSGNVILAPFAGNASIQTTTGAITVATQNATVTIVTKSANSRPIPMIGEHQIQLKTISGAIQVTEIK